MEKIELQAEPRTVIGKQVRRLRREGWVPAILYGPGVENRPLQIRAREAEEALERAGTSHLISLHIAGEKKPVQVLVRDYQRDVIHRNLLHLDLYQVQMTKVVTVDVPLVLVGESPAVERGEAVLIQARETLEIECLPSDLIDAIEVDLAQLTEPEQQITVADLAIPANIRVLADPDEPVVLTSPTWVPEEEEAEEEVAVEVEEAEPELVRKRKEEAEEEEKET